MNSIYRDKIQVTTEVVKFIKPSVLLISLFLLYLYLVPVIECGVLDSCET